MQSHMIKPMAVVLLALLATGSVIAAPFIVESRSAHAAKLDAVTERIVEIRARADRNDAAGLSTALGQIDADTNLGPAVRDYLLETTLLALSRTDPDSVARAAVSRYLNRPVTVLVRLNEGRGQSSVPLYDLAAAARLTNRVWDIEDAAERVSSLLNTSLWKSGDYLAPLHGLSLEAWQAGTQHAFESVERRFVAATKFALLKAQNQSHAYDSLLLFAATRLNDADLYDAIVMQGEARYARDAIESVYQSLSPANASRLMIRAISRPDLASTAILEMGKHDSNDQATRRWLLNRLGNRTDGASAALALARAIDDDILSSIQSIILGDAIELMKLRAALVLRLSESPAAQSLRQELLSRRLSNEKLRQAMR